MDKLTKPLYILIMFLIIAVVASISHAAFDEITEAKSGAQLEERELVEQLIIKNNSDGTVSIEQGDELIAHIVLGDNVLVKGDDSFYLAEGIFWQEDQVKLTSAQELMVKEGLTSPQVLQVYWGTAIDRVHHRQQISIYADSKLTRELAKIAVDQPVAVLETLFDGVYKVLLEEGTIGYADTRFVRITQSDLPPMYDGVPQDIDLSKVFVVSQDEQRLYIYEKYEGGYQLTKEIIISTGTEQEHTPNGYYSIKKRRGPWFFNPKYQAGGKYFVEFKGSYLLHSVACDKEGNPLPERVEKLGQKATSGCVGMPLEDAKYVYQVAKPNMLLIIDNKKVDVTQGLF